MKWCDYKVRLLNKREELKHFVKDIEYAARTCYRSHDRVKQGSGKALIRHCIKSGHESVLEHKYLSFEIICDRATMAAITRHRHTAFSIESTRYCNYSQDRFGGELTFVRSLNREFDAAIQPFLVAAEKQYNDLVQDFPPDLARAALPNMLKTTMIVTMNIRSLRHFIRLRTSPAAHPGIRVIADLMKHLMRWNDLGIFIEDI